MRIVTSLVFAVLIAAASVCVVPSSAHAWDGFIYYLSDKSCQGKPSAFKNGCFGYIESRTLNCMSEAPSLAKCKKYCDDWYSPNSNEKTTCYQGCDFMRSKD